MSDGKDEDGPESFSWLSGVTQNWENSSDDDIEKVCVFIKEYVHVLSDTKLTVQPIMSAPERIEFHVTATYDNGVHKDLSVIVTSEFEITYTWLSGAPACVIT